ncbi:protoporphyrinogen oxidase [Limisalsivibrio acetivorans]|uniref:protoporphyrinogen oxidase n=1 Tax=Limisalsivibrio acetivorans TaxID=1304888 RepID=UPI0003B6C9F9|nr:protoporphyrinogen oxidase [Limisalsivibrio acetivorans]
MNIGIIGGGISGVAAAFWLSQIEGLNITLLEKDKKLGGCIDTARQEGFSVEAGPNGFLDNKPHTLQLFEDAGLADKLYRSNDKARKRFIMRNGKLVRVPETPPSFMKTDLISFGGKMRLMGEILVSKKKDDKDETVAEFAKRRLGKEAMEYMISPMVSGVFAGDAEKLSLKSAFGVIYDLEMTYGGLFKGMLKKKKKKSGPAGPGGVLTSYKGGLINAIEDIASLSKGVDFVTNCEVKAVHKGERFTVETNKDTYSFDQVIICSPSYASAEFLKPLNEELAKEMADIAYSPAFVAGMGFRAEDIEDELDGFGYLIPRLENRRILGGLFTSSIFPERAPDGKKLIRVIMGGDTERGRRLMEHSSDELITIALEEIKDTVGVKAAPEVVQSFRWEKAIPQYYPGHSERVKRVESICSDIGGIHIGGNVLYGIALNDCTRVSWNIAESIRNTLEKG